MLPAPQCGGGRRALQRLRLHLTGDPRVLLDEARRKFADLLDPQILARRCADDKRC
jgi:hypothetical protein